MKIRNRIKFYIQKKKLNNVTVAVLMGVDENTVSRWCTNRCQPKSKQWEKLRDIFGCPMRKLFYISQD